MKVSIRLALVGVQELWGVLKMAEKIHFNDDGQFDKLYTVK